MQAIATAKSWLSSRPTLQHLHGIYKRPPIARSIGWVPETLGRSTAGDFIQCESVTVGFEARVAQYEFHSLNALEEKLSQFPAGAKFLLSLPPMDSTIKWSLSGRSQNFSRQSRNDSSRREARRLTRTAPMWVVKRREHDSSEL